MKDKIIIEANGERFEYPCQTDDERSAASFMMWMMKVITSGRTSSKGHKESKTDILKHCLEEAIGITCADCILLKSCTCAGAKGDGSSVDNTGACTTIKKWQRAISEC